MSGIARDQGLRAASQGRFKESLVIVVRQSFEKRVGRHRFPKGADLGHQFHDIPGRERKLTPAQDFPVFSNDPSIVE